MYPQHDFQPPEFTKGLPELSPEVERLLDLQQRLGVSDGNANAVSETNMRLTGELNESKRRIELLGDEVSLVRRDRDVARTERDAAYNEISQLKSKLAKSCP